MREEILFTGVGWERIYRMYGGRGVHIDIGCMGVGVRI